MDTMLDYYKILDIPQSASLDDIKKAYRSKVLRWHPDKNPENRKEAEQKFKEIMEAYKVLSDKSTRDHYDEISKDVYKGTKKTDNEKHISVFDQDGVKIFFTGQRSSSDFSVSFFSAPKRFHHFSIMTAFINGKKITTKRHLENENKYLEVEENGKTVSIHVNGIPVYDRECNGMPGNEWDYRLDKKFCTDRSRLWTCEKRRWADEWRCWANKWRDWAEECRNWAQGKHHQEDKGSSGATSGHHKADAECPKANEEYSKSDKGCHGPGAKHPGFPMPGEGKTSVNDGYSKTNKEQLQSKEEDSRSDKGYFVFPKPGEENSDLAEGYHRPVKKQQRPEDKGNCGILRQGNGCADQDDVQVRMKKWQTRPEEGQSRLDKIYHGSKKSDQASPGHKTSDPVCSESTVKHKIVSEYNSKAENRKLHIGRYKQQDEENNQQDENCARENELKGKNQKPTGENCELALESERDRAAKLNDISKKYPANAKFPHKPVLTVCGAKGFRTRKPYAKRSKSHAGRNKLCSSRNKSLAGKNRISDGHRKLTPDSLNGSREVASEGKKTPVDCKSIPKSKKKGSLPPLQEDKIPLLMRKGVPRRRTHKLPSGTRSEKYQFISDISQPLDINRQQQGRSIKMPRTNSCLPSIQGQKFGVNQLPNVTH